METGASWYKPDRIERERELLANFTPQLASIFDSVCVFTFVEGCVRVLFIHRFVEASHFSISAASV